MALMTDPFRALASLQKALDSTYRRAGQQTGWGAHRAFPPINVFRQNDEYVVVAEMPGVDKDGLEIQIDGSQLRVRGERRIEKAEGTSVHRRERRDGKFDRTFELPIRVDADKAQANFDNGILAVKLPQAESDKPKSVAIN